MKRARESMKRARGFTLLELLVAIVVAGVMVGIVSLSIGGFDRSLRFEAERLAQLLALAREEAQLRGAPIRFEADDESYRFSVWREPTIATCARADGNSPPSWESSVATGGARSSSASTRSMRRSCCGCAETARKSR